MRIQHNITAMNAYRNFSTNNSALGRNLEKLSAGYKINRAGDDAAGLAISEKMRAQITGLDTAQKNAKDGISLVQTAEGALTEVHDMLNRMVELAGQSANGTYADDVDREQLQKEIDQLRTEINRIADSANFNGIRLLNGDMEAKTATLSAVQVSNAVSGVAVSDHDPQAAIYTIDLSQYAAKGEKAASATSIAISVGGVTIASADIKSGATSINLGDATIKGVGDAAKAGKGVSIGGVTYELTIDGSKLTLTSTGGLTQELNGTGLTVGVAFNGGLTWDQDETQGRELALTLDQVGYPDSSDAKKYAHAEFDLDADKIVDGYQLKLGDTTYTFAVGSDSKYTRATNKIDLTEFKEGATDIEKIAAHRLSDVASDNKTFIVASDANSGKVYVTERKGGVDYNEYNLGEKEMADLVDVFGQLIQDGNAPDDIGGLTLQIGDTSAYYDQLNVSIQDMHTASLGIDTIDITTQAGANSAMDKIKAAINTVSDVRGTLGATQNRLDHTINNLSVMVENITDAESTIRDTDMASEMMAYTKNSILVQAAQAMLAQANQLPQGVLQLLQ